MPKFKSGTEQEARAAAKMGGRIPWKKEEHPVEVIGHMRLAQQSGGIRIQVAKKA